MMYNRNNRAIRIRYSTSEKSLNSLTEYNYTIQITVTYICMNRNCNQPMGN